MKQYRLSRDGAVDLEFEGEVLAEVSSEPDGKKRWSRLRLYKTTSNKYVVEQLGESAVQGEHTRRTVSTHDDRSTIPAALKRGTVARYLSNLAIELIEVAARVDPTLADLLVERI